MGTDTKFSYWMIHYVDPMSELRMPFGAIVEVQGQCTVLIADKVPGPAVMGPAVASTIQDLIEGLQAFDFRIRPNTVSNILGPCCVVGKCHPLAFDLPDPVAWVREHVVSALGWTGQ